MRRGCSSAILWLILTVAAQAQSPPRHRVFGPLAVDVAIDDKMAQATVDLSIGGQQASHAVVTFDQPAYDFDIAAEGAKASGTLKLNIAQAPSPSNLAGRFTVWAVDGKPVPFKGELASWTAADDLILIAKTMALSSSLEAHTIVRNGAPSGAEVDLVAGQQQLFSAVMLPPSPVATTPLQLVIGDLRIQAGARLTLTPPSLLAAGSMFLECTFQSATVAPTSFSGQIASWPSPLPTPTPAPVPDDKLDQAGAPSPASAPRMAQSGRGAPPTHGPTPRRRARSAATAAKRGARKGGLVDGRDVSAGVRVQPVSN